MNRVSNFLHSVAEQTYDATRMLFPFSWGGISSIRQWMRPLGLRFWNTSHPTGEGSIVNYEYTRQLYRNSGELGLGSGFAKPIVDLQVGFMGIPTVSTDNDATNQFLNECLSDHWVDEIQQMFRDSIRDSVCYVRLAKPDIFDPLMTMDEAEHGKIEILPPERVDIERNGANKNIIERALIRHRMVFVRDEGDPAQGVDPVTEEHDVIEIIDRQMYRFFDQTTNEWITTLETENRAGFVPILEVWNEWDSSLQGGQSDLESVVPFIRAFHDVLTQGLQAHKYHSTPKVLLKLDEVGQFLKNNFPEALDELTGEIKPNSEISWRGNEIIFLQREDDMAFLEARSVLGDTKTLLEFLIDCICIASETPEWAFMRVDSGSANSDRNAQTVPFVKKIDRKRKNYTKPVQELCKMILVLNGEIPVRARVSWDTVRADDQMVQMQAFQQLVMGLEVARARGLISDEAYQREIAKFIPSMKSPAQELSPPDQPALPAGTKQGTPVKAGPQGANE